MNALSRVQPLNNSARFHGQGFNHFSPRVVINDTRRFSWTPTLQRSPSCACGGGCPRCKHGEQPIQPKLKIGAPDDVYEQEADRVADAVMRMPAPPTVAEPLSDTIERNLLQSKPRITALGNNPSSVGSSISQADLPAISENGHPLPESVQNYLAPRFVRDLSHVQVHSSPQAAQAATKLNARAFTVGSHIVFGANEYAPNTQAGRVLLAHEITHIFQQQKAPSPNRIQRIVFERNFPGGGRVEQIRSGEYLVWNFDINQHTLKSEHTNGISLIAPGIIATLNQDPNWEVDVEGQASLTGTDAVNAPLSQQRAEEVRTALNAAGVSTSRIKQASVGSRKSLPAISQENLARSRAVRIILVPRIATPQPQTPPSATPGQPTQPTTPTPEVTPETPPRSIPPTTQPSTQPAPPSGAPPSQAPACRASTPIMTLSGGSVTLHRNGGQVTLQAGDGTPSNIGMTFLAAASLSTAGCGNLLFVQNVRPFREIVYKDGTRLRMTANSFVLDTSDPYPSWPLPGASQGMLMRHTNDSPALGTGRLGNLAFTEGLIASMEIRDEFLMFLLFQPIGGRRQSLMVATWTWVGQALNSTSNLPSATPPFAGGGNLVLDTNVSRIIPSNGTGSATTRTPITSTNITSIRFVIDRGGISGTRTFADLFDPILNGRGGARTP